MKFLSAIMMALVAVLNTPSLVAGHSWIEQLMVIAPNGTMIGQPGFPRNFVQRTPTFQDSSMVWLIPPNGDRPVNEIDASQMMCRPEQTTQVQSSGSPRLQASPGQSVALRYQENGHVTLPSNTPGKPKGSGANFVYYTTNSKPDDKFLQIHRQWNANGTGGDARGRLLSTQNFDDGQCYQINAMPISQDRQQRFKHDDSTIQGQALWCQQDIQIPTDAQPNSTVTLYWVWDWPTAPGTAGFPEGKQEMYTTCMDVDIVAPVSQAKAAVEGFVVQDFANAAISAQFADIANPTAVSPQEIPFSSIAAAPATGTSSQPSSASSTFSNTTAAPQVGTPVAPTTAPIPHQVTVTVLETVTATMFSNQTRRGNRPQRTATVFDTVTVTFSPLSAKKHEAIQSLSSIASHSTACSKTASAYRLRARNPFYILPNQDQPSPVAGDEC